MKNIASTIKRSFSTGPVIIFAAVILLAFCNGCSKKGICPAYTYKAKKDASTTARAIKIVADEG